ncbi:hypothetical protein ACFYWN_42755 [Streptomyces sp. NPDC002917]|uniref:hypothetical protein n=1 Tax=Streptomyces sp. NPDC002917 TaxID=3364671 RepID=UPI00367EA85A
MTKNQITGGKDDGFIVDIKWATGRKLCCRATLCARPEPQLAGMCRESAVGEFRKVHGEESLSV